MGLNSRILAIGSRRSGGVICCLVEWNKIADRKDLVLYDYETVENAPGFANYLT